MPAKLALLFIALSCTPLCLADPPCDFRDHVQPIFVKNSKYTVQENGKICCPATATESECIPKDVMECICPHGTVYEPCRHCRTCARGPGEMCGGVYGAIGECAAGLKCTADKERFLDGYNDTGICVGEVERDLYEQCGGEFGEQGICKDGLDCLEVGSEHICVNASDLKGVCNKNCSDRKKSEVCGSDGRVYQNICFLRQQTCKQDLHLNKMDMTVCSRAVACPDITPPSNGYVKFSYRGLKRGANATILCNHGYRQFFPATSVHPSNMPPLECDCVGGTCTWVSQRDRTPWKDGLHLPKCVSERERQCGSQSPPVTMEMPKPSEPEGIYNNEP